VTLLVLGATGLLGQAMVAEARARGIVVRGAARKGADIALDVTDPAALVRVLEAERPNTIVNCAALVDVAACEADPGRAYKINAAPSLSLGGWCRAARAKLVQVSTDHFFDEDGPAAHDEDARVTLLNHYAATKYAAERFALLDPGALVLRTSIVGIRAWAQPSFAEWAIAAILEDREMTLFEDAYTSSIDTPSFANACLDLVEADASGLLNLAASQVYSKEAFIRALAEVLGKSLRHAKAGTVGMLSPPRPRSLGLDVARAECLLGRTLPDLDAVVRNIVSVYWGSP
jgi:dTDP-4-dehydrorhamnose reductase